MTSRSFPSDVGQPLHAPLPIDIAVIGAGMAGVMAALAAKTADNSVLLIEPSNVLGGQGTAGGVAGFCGDTARVNHPFSELVNLLERQELIEPYRPNDDRRGYDLEWCAFFLQEMVVARDIKILLHSRVVDVRTESSRVTELTVSTAGGLLTITPKFVIDASGACIVPVLAGFPVAHCGANLQLPMSLYFTLWDTGKKVKPILPEGCPRWPNDEEIPMTSLHCFSTGKVEVKMKVVGFDAADGWSRSSAEIFARRQMHGLIYYLQTIGYRGRRLDSHVLASVSRGIGVREERRIVGEHVLTEAEARRAVIFPDAVAVNTYHIDFHWPDRMQRAGTGITDMLDPHHLPLRMMIPKGAKNLLVPGRGASGDQTAMSAFRVMAVVAQMGFAAGHAARQCVERRTDLAEIDVPLLQAAIKAGGQSLNLSDYGDYLRADLYTHELVNGDARGLFSPSPLSLTQVENACFVLTWRDAPSNSLWIVERRERQWHGPRKSETSSASFPISNQVALRQGALVRWFSRDGSRLALQLSNDGGSTWPHECEIASKATLHCAPALAPTTTGVALAYVDGEGRMMFWHGSEERIVSGPPVSAAIRLGAGLNPIDEQHLSR